MSDKAPLILLAAGGTGGHVFPAEALTRELLGRGARVGLVTDKRGTQFSSELVVPVYRVHASSLGTSLFRKVLSFGKMGVGVIQALLLIKKLKPAAVVGFGGYPSFPLLYAASRTNVPILLHEQNAVLGRANRSLLPLAKILATSFPQIRGLPSQHNAVLVHTGNPVRPAFTAQRATLYPALLEDGPIRLLVLGGSLGAKVFSYVVPKALSLLPATLKRRILVSQQCRAEDIDAARLAFAGAGIEAEVSTFFKDVPERMAEATLVIGRSGGGAIAELTTVGRPSILVPFPHGHAGEQLANAEAIAQAGGAWIIPEKTFTPEALAVRLEALFSLPSNLTKAATAARAWGTVAAADHLANAVFETIGLSQAGSNANRTNNPDVSGKEDSLAISTREFYQ